MRLPLRTFHVRVRHQSVGQRLHVVTHHRQHVAGVGHRHGILGGLDLVEDDVRFPGSSEALLFDPLIDECDYLARLASTSLLVLADDDDVEEPAATRPNSMRSLSRRSPAVPTTPMRRRRPMS